jgi:hypothetical protein
MRGFRQIDLHMRSADGRVEIKIVGHAAERLDETSLFGSISEASAFFEAGGVGYSVTASGRRLDGIVLKTSSWTVAPLAIERDHSSYFTNQEMFPAGSIDFDCALVYAEHCARMGGRRRSHFVTAGDIPQLGVNGRAA